MQSLCLRKWRRWKTCCIQDDLHLIEIVLSLGSSSVALSELHVIITENCVVRKKASEHTLMMLLNKENKMSKTGLVNLNEFLLFFYSVWIRMGLSALRILTTIRTRSSCLSISSYSPDDPSSGPNCWKEKAKFIRMWSVSENPEQQQQKVTSFYIQIISTETSTSSQ